VPARLLHRAWLHGDRPSAEAVLGRVDVVHGTNFVLPPPRRAAGVVTVHDLTFVRHPDWVSPASLTYRTLVPRAVGRAAAVIAPSQAIADEIADAYGVPPERLAVTHLGVEPAWFTAPPPLAGWPSEYVLAVGTMEPRKGLDVLAAAYRRLLADDPQAPPLVLVGPSGWGAQPDLAALPPGQVRVPGYLDPDELRAAVANARVLAFPSRYEGFGLPPLEAMAAGTPVVASDIPAVREVTAGHARLVPVGDAAELAVALSGVLHTPPDAAAREAARTHARQFTWSACAESTAAVYRRVSR
jgi:glycosyltransferase involved in cell wall biosynthesis